MEDLIRAANGFVWGIPMLAFLLGTGVFLTIGLRFISLSRIPWAFAQAVRRSPGGSGDVSPFGALMTALSSTIGTGNIAGVAAAIAIGGPGAVFWMWMTAVVGTATKFSEGVLALKFREVAPDGRHIGGPMYYIKNGMGPKWMWLAVLFAALGILGSWGTGSYIQANSVADAVRTTYGGAEGSFLYQILPLLVGAVLALAAAAVILGGVQRIASVASRIVPFMAIAYIGAGLIVIGLNADQVPGALGLIVRNAFGYDSATAGISIGLLMLAMQKGVARGIFSNEAGQGSAPIAHAAAKSDDPISQGTVAMLGTVIDTLIVCTITALVILTSGVIPEACVATSLNIGIFQEGGQPMGCDTGAPLTAGAFDLALPGVGQHIVAIGLSVFAFTTILGWSYYGERCAEFLFGSRIVTPFRISWIVVTFLGAASLLLESQVANAVNLFWLVTDTTTGLMAAPNLVALIVLSPLVFRMARERFGKTR